MPRRISGAEATPLRVAIVTLDDHLASATERAGAALRGDFPGLALTLHSAAEWGQDAAALKACLEAIGEADIVVATMLFMEEHIRAVLPALEARREHCDAMVCCMSAAEVTKLTRMGRLRMGGEGGALGLLKKLRGGGGKSTGARQLKMLKRIPQILRFIPGTAQDLRAYFLTLQYWLAGSDRNVASLVRLLVDRYADGPRKALRGRAPAAAPIDYPEVGLYHPALGPRIANDPAALPRGRAAKGRVGLLVMRSYVLAANTAHYDGVIAALEAKGLDVVPAFASGLDARPAIERFFVKEGKATVDALVSLTGFSLVGGPAYNDAEAAEQVLAGLDVPYLAAQPVEMQTLEQWRASERGLMPVEQTIMVAIPELDGATGPIVFGGRSQTAGAGLKRDMAVEPERAAMLAARVARLVALRKTPRAARRLAIVLFNFPPNAGNVGTAGYLSVFRSLHNTLRALRAEGWTVELPADAEALRRRIVEGNAARFGASANVHARLPVDDHVRREPHLAEIESQWGPAPGRHQADGASLHVYGERFGEVFVGVQPAFGYEGDPMRLLFERGFAPTHAFSAFYRWLREDFRADAVLHFGMHGALEFMPGKQAGLSAACWPDRLIQDLPNVYLYAANNPSEGTIAKRRSAATIVTYLTPPVARAGLYRGLIDLKASLERWRGLSPDAAPAERSALAGLVQAQAAAVDLGAAEPAWGEAAEAETQRLVSAVLELEYALIPHGLHVVGEGMGEAELADTLAAVAEASGKPVSALADTARMLAEDHEIPGLLRALDARYVRPAPAGDLVRTPAILPTGRNLHGFDPFRIPSAFALLDGARQAERLLARHLADGHRLPETVALVLWGTDNLKSEGGPIAQALALLGARPRFDGYGRLAGAELVALDELKRPRIDVVITLSGIFRDLLPLQTRLLAEAAYLAASADEPAELNFVRKHALAAAAAQGIDIEAAALRVFSNADGAYGSNVNHLVESGAFADEDELAEQYSRRKCFAYGRAGAPAKQPQLLESLLSGVDLAYQNLESVELGVTSLDQYFDTLGGISRAVTRERGAAVPVYIGDQTRGEGAVRSLSEQVALETRTRMLNPKWYEAMLTHGFEGVRQIDHHMCNTVGWSATTGQVAPWVYAQITRTYVLDETMRKRLADLNPHAAAKFAGRLIEAHERNYWTPDAECLEALRRAGEELEDRLEGVGLDTAA
jgi:magnesium chelatase subunit H